MNFKDKKIAPAKEKSVLNKTLKYASISAVAAGSALGTAQAVDLTANDIWGDANILNNGNTITNPVADLDIELNDNTEDKEYIETLKFYLSVEDTMFSISEQRFNEIANYLMSVKNKWDNIDSNDSRS